MITNYLKNKLLDNWFRNESYDFPDTIYIGLSQTAPTETGGNITETVAPSYARCAILTDNTIWDSANNGSIDNSVPIRFAEAGEDWTTSASPFSHYVIFDSLTGGNALFYGELIHTQQVPLGAIVEIPAHGLRTTILNA